jgi:hypothetical protein
MAEHDFIRKQQHIYIKIDIGFLLETHGKFIRREAVKRLQLIATEPRWHHCR